MTCSGSVEEPLGAPEALSRGGELCRRSAAPLGRAGVLKERSVLVCSPPHGLISIAEAASGRDPLAHPPRLRSQLCAWGPRSLLRAWGWTPAHSLLRHPCNGGKCGLRRRLSWFRHLLGDLPKLVHDSHTDTQPGEEAHISNGKWHCGRGCWHCGCGSHTPSQGASYSIHQAWTRSPSKSKRNVLISPGNYLFMK